MNELLNILNLLKQGQLSAINADSVSLINNLTKNYLNKDLDDYDLDCIYNILLISNILYNNTDKSILPLEDGVYDLLLVKYNSYRNNAPVGAEPINFKNNGDEYENANIKILNKIEREMNEDNFLFMEELTHNPGSKKIYRKIIYKDDKCHQYIPKRNVNIKHNYPKLVGTLDKAKFVLNQQAIEKGVFNDTNVQILERDFFGKHIQSGILSPTRRFKMVVMLKYDGISIEADVNTMIINARTRGDANNDIAADMTPILFGYNFKDVPKEFINIEPFGMKFEAIISYLNLYKFNQMKNKQYKNCRTAISGLFSSSDACKYKDLITLVPLATSLDFDNKIEEIEFMNTFYSTGENLRYAVIEGTYIEILFQIKRFVEEAELMRDIMPFMYDGVVVSYLDKDLIDKLGRVKSVDKFSMAVKFNPLKKLTIFRGYTYTIGQDGTITPMIHYDPVEFYGTIHDKSSGHSFERFKSLSLREGDILESEYVGDVMPYITKPDNSHNANNNNPVIEFIKICPSCGKELKISDTGKTVYCDNIECPERNLQRMVNLMDKLNLKDFSESYLKQIGKYSLTDLMNISIDEVKFLGEITAQKFIDRMEQLKNEPIHDYTIIGSLGFTGIAKEKWKLILNKFSLLDLLNMDSNELINNLVNIKGIGPNTAEVIATEMFYFHNDLMTILNMQNVIHTKGAECLRKIRFTGFRDSELNDYLNKIGFDSNQDAGVTKDTYILLVPDVNHSSSKTIKANKYNVQIVDVNTFKENITSYL